MYQIKKREFYPVPGDKDFKVTILPLTNERFMDIQIESSKTEPSGGPQAGKDSSASDYKSYVKRVFDSAIVKIDGCYEENGSPVVDGEGLCRALLARDVASIMKEILKDVQLEEREIKN